MNQVVTTTSFESEETVKMLSQKQKILCLRTGMEIVGCLSKHFTCGLSCDIWAVQEELWSCYWFYCIG